MRRAFGRKLFALAIGVGAVPLALATGEQLGIDNQGDLAAQQPCLQLQLRASSSPTEAQATLATLGAKVIEARGSSTVIVRADRAALELLKSSPLIERFAFYKPQHPPTSGTTPVRLRAGSADAVCPDLPTDAAKVNTLEDFYAQSATAAVKQEEPAAATETTVQWQEVAPATNGKSETADKKKR